MTVGTTTEASYLVGGKFGNRTFLTSRERRIKKTRKNVRFFHEIQLNKSWKFMLLKLGNGLSGLSHPFQLYII